MRLPELYVEPRLFIASDTYKEKEGNLLQKVQRYLVTESGNLNETSTVPTESNDLIPAVELAINDIENGLTKKGTNYPYTEVRFKPLMILGESSFSVDTIEEATCNALLRKYVFSIFFWRK